MPNAVARHFSLTHHGAKDSLRSLRERPPGRRRRGMSRLHLGKPVDPGFTRSAVACRDAATRHPPATQREHARHRPSDRRCPSELHEGRTSLPPPRGRALMPAGAGPHRIALRRRDVGCVLCRPRPASTGPSSRRRQRQPCRADGEGDGRLRDAVPRRRPRLGGGRRRRQLDHGLHARREEAEPPCRPPGGGAPQRRPHDAGGDQLRLPPKILAQLFEPPR